MLEIRVRELRFCHEGRARKEREFGVELFLKSCFVIYFLFFCSFVLTRKVVLTTVVVRDIIVIALIASKFKFAKTALEFVVYIDRYSFN